MAKVLITGARGFIGKYLAREMAQNGHVVCGLGHGAWPEVEAGDWGVSHWLNGEVTAGNLHLLREMAGSPDFVIHLAGGSSVGAAIANPREDFQRTVGSTVELLEWLRLNARSAKLLAVSSAAVYGSGHAGQISEGDPGAPYSPYGFHKQIMELLCESYAESYGVSVLIVRLFSVYGVALRKQLLWDLCCRLAKGENPVVLGGTGGELRDWTEVRDVVRALRQLLERAPVGGGPINVGTGVGVSVQDISRLVTRLWAIGSNPSLRVEFSGKSRPGDPYSLVSNPKLIQATGFEWDVGLEKGLGDFVRWFRSLESTSTWQSE